MPAALACPRCHGELTEAAAGWRCRGCGAVYARDAHGYFVLLPTDVPTAAAIESTVEAYAEEQHRTGARVYAEYLRPYLAREPAHRVLDVGCGVGAEVSHLVADGYDAYGLDLPGLTRFWQRAGNDPRRFFAGDAAYLPFLDGYFDAVYSLGVIEHIGTLTGHCTLGPDYEQARRRFAREIVRVTRPGGRILIACPNKAFPVDIQHGPNDQLSPPMPLRAWLFEYTGLTLHRTWGRYHLLSYPEVRRLFLHEAGARRLRPLPLRGYFGFGRFKRGFLRPFARLAQYYVDHLPPRLRATPLNPYVLVEIRR